LIREAKFTEDGHVYEEASGIVVPSVTQICQSVGLYSTNGIPKDSLEWKSGLGIETHAVCALVDRGENLDDYEIDPRVLPYVDSYREFKAVGKWAPYLVEHGPFIADVNGMPVGFRLDRVGMLNGVESVAEIKCTAADHPYHGVQLSGYDLCLGEKKRARFVIRLQPDGKIARVKAYNDASEYGVFTWALSIVTWKGNKRI
jgi:hypothetical protein